MRLSILTGIVGVVMIVAGVFTRLAHTAATGMFDLNDQARFLLLGGAGMIGLTMVLDVYFDL